MCNRYRIGPLIWHLLDWIQGKCQGGGNDPTPRQVRKDPTCRPGDPGLLTAAAAKQVTASGPTALLPFTAKGSPIIELVELTEVVIGWRIWYYFIRTATSRFTPKVKAV